MKGKPMSLINYKVVCFIVTTSKTALFVLAIFLFFSSSETCAQLKLDIETGVVFSGYNDVRIPNETGTKISLTDDLKTDPNIFSRAKLIYKINDKHTLTALAAPLRLEADGSINKTVRFYGEEFPPNIKLKSIYRFDSYRLTYRYKFYDNKNMQVGLGFTAKIRDASISLKGANKEAEKKNTGFVPLINFRGEWRFSKNWTLVLDGDALAAPQGRAEDVFLGAEYNMAQNVNVKFGYRILEGGADAGEVYTFALLHYFVIGAILTF
jgi:hypothetical protein